MSTRFDALPVALKARANLTMLCQASGSHVPSLLVTAEGVPDGAAPTLIWLHGRTAWKELDPGRYLRLMRSGINVCAVDLPGHGERLDDSLQGFDAIAAVVNQAIDEVDPIVTELVELGFADPQRMALGGMSAGGMVTLGRLCWDHPFRSAAVESTTGDWGHRYERGFFGGHDEVVASRSPIDHLSTFREIPILALHSITDQRVAFAPQERFLRRLAQQYGDQQQIQCAVWDSTGAPMEHDGFGRESAEAKDLHRTFLEATLTSARLPDGAALHDSLESVSSRARLLW
jgi:pimeloyl-ACP methyl ester carboxylesterase